MPHTKRLLLSLAKSVLIILLLTLFIVFSIDVVPAVEHDEMASFPELYIPALRVVLYLITPIPFYALAQQFDTFKRKELLATYTGLPTKRQIMLQTLRSFSFWSDTLCLLLPLTAMSALNAIPDLILQGREVGGLIHYGLKLICYALPLAAIFLYIEGSIRRSWYREWEFASRTSKNAVLDDLVREHPSYGMLVFNVACIAGGTWLLPAIFWGGWDFSSRVQMC